MAILLLLAGNWERPVSTVGLDLGHNGKEGSSVNEIEVRLESEDADAAELDELVGRLMNELLDLDVSDIRRREAGPAPQGTKAAGVADVGSLLVEVASSGALLSVLQVVRDWFSRQKTPRTKVRVSIGGDEIELSRATAADQEKLIAAFIAHHSGP